MWLISVHSIQNSAGNSCIATVANVCSAVTIGRSSTKATLVNKKIQITLLVTHQNLFNCMYSRKHSGLISITPEVNLYIILLCRY